MIHKVNRKGGVWD